MPKVSIIIPCRNEVAHIAKCLRQAVATATPSITVEVCVVDGMSNDGTREAIQAFASQFPQVRMIDNLAQTTPQAFNLGIANTDGEYVCIIGARMLLEANYLTVCLEKLTASPDLRCVGGRLENEYETYVSRLIALAMASPFGVGGGNWRIRTKDSFVDTVTAPLYPRSLFKEVGLFDEELMRNQDDEFNFRVTKAGHKILFTADTSLKYFVRAAYGKLFRQYFQYGYWKVFVNKKHKAVTSMRQLVPAIFVLGLLVALTTGWIHPWWRISVGFGITAYIAMALVMGVRVGATASQLPGVMAGFFILHLSYGLGYWNGILDFIILGRKPRSSQRALSR